MVTFRQNVEKAKSHFMSAFRVHGLLHHLCLETQAALFSKKNDFVKNDFWIVINTVINK